MYIAFSTMIATNFILFRFEDLKFNILVFLEARLIH